jgi:hypothetical protein
VNVTDINVTGISWIAVQKYLNNERRPLDYLRIWKTVARRVANGKEQVVVNDNSVSVVSTNTVVSNYKQMDVQLLKMLVEG